MGGDATDFVDQGKGDVHAGFLGNGLEMEHGVGGTPQGHVHGQGVAEGRLRQDIQGTDVLPEQFHHSHARLFGQSDSLGHGTGDGAVAGKSHADGLGEAVHGIGREHAGTGAAGGAGGVLDLCHLFRAHFTGTDGAYGFKDRDEIDFFVLIPGILSRQHGAAADAQGRNIEPGCGHEHARNDLVTVGHQDHGVKGMGRGRDFNGIGNEFPAGQGVVHAGMVHGNAVTYADGGKFHGRAASHADSGFNRLYKGVQVHVTGNQFVGGVGNAHQGTFDLFIRKSHGFHQTSVGGPCRSFFGNVTSHPFVSPLIFIFREDSVSAGKSILKIV